MSAAVTREVQCPSGAILKVRPARFADSKKLYQVLLAEIRRVEIRVENMEMGNLMKDLFCIGFSSPHIEEAMQKCFEVCLYNNGQGDRKIDKDTFEPVEARQDYIMVCVEVARDNIDPFTKSLFAQFSQFTSTKAKSQKSK